MKKFLAVVLMLLMVLPLGVMSYADEVQTPTEITKVDLPDKPTVVNPAIYYVAASNTTDPVPEGAQVTVTSGWDPINYPAYTYMFDIMKDGGTYVASGKCYVGAECTILETATPCLFTAIDPTTGKDYRSKTAEGEYEVVNAEGGNAGQKGMFMIRSTNTYPDVATFMGDVIFDNICILDRSGADAYVSSTLKAGSTSRMVITENVDVIKMHVRTTNLAVDEGGYIFLNTTGFQSYKGTGTIVLGDVAKAALTEADFADFKGLVVDEEGNVIYNKIETEEDKPDTTPDTKPSAPDTKPATPDTKPSAGTTGKDTSASTKPTTTPGTKAPVTNNSSDTANNAHEEGGSPVIWIVVGVAAAAVAAVVVIVVLKKKKAE